MVLVTGADNLVGRLVARELVAAGQTVRVAFAPGQAVEIEGAETSEVDWYQPEQRAALLTSVDALVLCDVIEPSHRTAHDLEAAVLMLDDVLTDVAQAGERPVVLLSHLGVERGGGPGSRYLAAAHEAELLVLNQPGLAGVVLRCAPTMQQLIELPLCGNPGRSGRLWVAGASSAVISPVAPQDIAATVRAVLDKPQLAGRILKVVGPETFTWRELARVFDRAYQREVRVTHLPLWLVTVARVLIDMFSPRRAAALSWLEQVQTNDHAADARELVEATGVVPRDFANWLHQKAGAPVGPGVATPREPLRATGDNEPLIIAPEPTPWPVSVTELMKETDVLHATAEAAADESDAAAEAALDEPPVAAVVAPEPPVIEKRPPVARPKYVETLVVDADPD